MAAYESIAAVDKLTKNLFKDGIVDQMLQGAPLYKSLRKSPIDLGTDMTGVIQTTWNQAIGSRGNRGDLPDPAEPSFLNPSWDARHQYVVLDISGVELEKTKNNKRAMGVLVAKKIKDAWTAFAREAEYQAFGDGTGKRCIVNAAVAAGSSKTIQATAATYPLRGIFPGMVVDFYNETTGTKVTEATVASVNRAAGTFVVSSLAVPLSGAEGVYRKGNRNLEWNGLTNLVNDSTGPATVLGIASTEDRWQSKVKGNSGTTRNLTIELLDDLYYDVMEEDDTEPDTIWLDYQQMKKLVQIHNRNLEYSNASGNSMTLNGHNEVVKYGNAAVRVSSMAPAGKLFMLHQNDFMMDELVPFRWITEENAKNIWQKVRGKHVFEATAWCSGEIVVGSRRLHGVITDLAKS